VLGVI
jgi:hypothetical protein